MAVALKYTGTVDFSTSATQLTAIPKIFLDVSLDTLGIAIHALSVPTKLKTPGQL